jgi:hypothetical protein
MDNVKEHHCSVSNLLMKYIILSVLFFGLFLCRSNLLAQPVIKDVFEVLEKDRRKLDRQINWELIRHHCSHDSAWTIHVPVVGLSQPGTQEDFLSGRFVDFLVPVYLPKRIMKRKLIRTESTILNNTDQILGGVSMLTTYRSCNDSTDIVRLNMELLKIYKNGNSAYIMYIGWYAISGYLYNRLGTWYLLECKHGRIRNEPLSVFLEEEWDQLRRYKRVASGEWSKVRP